MTLLSKVTALVLIVQAATLTCAAAVPPDEDCSAQLVKLFATASQSTATGALAAQAARYIDYGYIARHAVGDPAWRRLAPGERERCVGLVRRHLETRHYPRWHRMFLKGRYTERGRSHTGPFTVVRGSLAIGRSRQSLVWKLHRSGGDCQIINLSVNGKDLALRLRSRFQRQLAHGGHKRLVAYLSLVENVDNDM